MRNVPPKTIERVLLYIRTLERLTKAKRFLVSSKELAEITGVTDVQIRKDISNFGKVGTPRIGYKTKDLKDILEVFLLEKDTVRAVLFGTGNLGSAILNYQGFRKGRIKLVAAFDKDHRKIGKLAQGVRIHAVEDAPKVIKRKHAEIGIIAVPKESAQEIADIMVMAKLGGIINFAPTSISVPQSVQVKDIDFTIEFLSLFCGMRRAQS